MEYNVYTIEGKEYIEIDAIIINSTTYLVLSSKENVEDFCIRKVTTIDGLEYLEGLETNEEFDEVMIQFTNKHKDEITSL